MEFHIHTDHKPLVPLFGSKNLEELPVRVQRFRLRMMRFKFTISHIPGKNLLLADALSRAPISEAVNEDLFLQQETAAYVSTVVQSLPATEKWSESGDIRRKMRSADKVLSTVDLDGLPDNP